MATSGMTVDRQAIIDKWSSLGFLDGLEGHVKDNIATLYESQASALLNEEPSPSQFEYVQFPMIRFVMDRWEDQENKLVINKLKKHKL